MKTSLSMLALFVALLLLFGAKSVFVLFVLAQVVLFGSLLYILRAGK